jgi:preprotein translocase subunit SecY
MLQSLDSAFYRRLAVTMAALAVFRLGSYLPVPGLAPEVVAEAAKGTSIAIGRLSLFALGIMPLLNALILTELLKLLLPSVRRWEQAPRNAGTFRYVVIGLALLLALAQGLGVARALEGVAHLVPEPGRGFQFVCTMTFVAGAALVMALAAVIDRAGLGSGMWLLFLTPTLVELPENLATISQLYESGQYPLAAIVRSAMFTAFATAGVVSIILAARGSRPTAAACAWTLLLSYSVLTWVLIGVGLAVTGGSIEGAVALITAGNLVRYAVLAAVVVLIAWLYVRSIREAGLPSPIPAAPIAAVMVAIAIAAELLQTQLSTALPLGSVQIVVAAVVATTMLIDWGVVGGEDQPAEDDGSEPLSPRA